jgi:hypothetical protein
MTVLLPTGWEPRRVGANLEFPDKPISSPVQLMHWLSYWIARRIRWKAKLQSQPEMAVAHKSPPLRMPRTVRVQPHDACDFIDLCREMRNARRALGEWDINGAPRWDGDPPRDWTDEERLNSAIANMVELRDWLRSRATNA